MEGASRVWKFAKSNSLREYEVDLMGPAFDFHVFPHALSFVWSKAVCSATSRRDLFLQLLNLYHIISAVTALQAAAQPEVPCLIFCVLRDEHLSIDLSVHFFASPAASSCWLRLLYRRYIPGIRLAATS